VVCFFLLELMQFINSARKFPQFCPISFDFAGCSGCSDKESQISAIPGKGWIASAAGGITLDIRGICLGTTARPGRGEIGVFSCLTGAQKLSDPSPDGEEP
jgi:hypothetical protein